MSEARKRLRIAFYIFSIGTAVSLYYFVTSNTQIPEESKSLMLAFVAELVGVVILAFAYAFFMIDDTKDLERKIDHLIVSNSGSLGSLQVHSEETLARERFIDAIAKSKEIVMIGYSFANDLKQFSEPLKDFLTAGGRLEVILLDPNSTAGQTMAEAVGDWNLVSEPIARSKRYLEEIGQDHRDNVKLRLANWIPSTSLWLFEEGNADGRLFVGINGLTVTKGRSRRIYTWIDSKTNVEVYNFFKSQVEAFDHSPLVGEDCLDF